MDFKSQKTKFGSNRNVQSGFAKRSSLKRSPIWMKLGTSTHLSISINSNDFIKITINSILYRFDAFI